MVPVRQQVLSFLEEVLVQVWNLATYPHGTDRCFPSNIGVGGRHKGFDFGEQITGHFNRRNISEGTESETDDILVGVVKVTAF